MCNTWPTSYSAMQSLYGHVIIFIFYFFIFLFSTRSIHNNQRTAHTLDLWFILLIILCFLLFMLCYLNLQNKYIFEMENIFS